MRKINTLQSLRFFAFLMIFLLHTKTYHPMTTLYNSALGVSFFIILSGFLSGYKYYDYNKHYTYIDIKKFAVNRIKKFYTLHLVMLVVTIPLSGIFILVTKKDFSGIVTWIKSFISNVLLIQDYFSDGYFNFNGVSWFLSLMVFLAIITIPLIDIISKISNKYKGVSKLVLCLICVIIFDYIYVLFVKNHSLKMEYWLYIFPPSRIPEYVLGLITGFIIGKKKDTILIKNYTILEILSIVCVIIAMKYFNFSGWQWGFSWMIPSIFLIVIFSFEKGMISKLLSNKLLVRLGNITFEAFLIHQVIVKYFYFAVGDKLSRTAKVGALIYIFILTIILSSFVHSYMKRDFSIKCGTQND